MAANPITWISAERFGPFVEAAGGDAEAAMRLYEWHAEVLQTSFGLMQHFEVLLRNAIDGRLGAGQAQSPLRETWLMDFDVLQPHAVKQVIIAVERLEERCAISRARVIAGLSFGFWSGLFGGKYEELWRHDLRHAFPKARERKDLSTRLQRLRRFRNRLAHHDSLLRQDVDGRLRDLLEVAHFVSPDAAAWLLQQSDLRAVLQRRPPS